MDNRRNNKFYEEEVKTDFKFIFIRSYSLNTDSFSKALIYIYLSHQDTVSTLLAQIENRDILIQIDDDEFLRHPKTGTSGYLLPGAQVGRQI